MKLIALIMVIVVAAAVLLLGIALLLNRLPWWSPPGPLERARVYLTTNVAATRSDHVFPELRPLRVAQPPADLYPRVVEAIEALGWTVALTDVARHEVRATVKTPLLGFEDDLLVTVEAAPGGGSVVEARSASRVGRGDLGANTRHILDLYAALGRLPAVTTPPAREPDTNVDEHGRQ